MELNRLTKKPTGKVKLELSNVSKNTLSVQVRDKSYGRASVEKTLVPGAKETLTFDVTPSHHWYDYEVLVKGNTNFYQQFAGHIETGETSITDPLMGRMV